MRAVPLPDPEYCKPGSDYYYASLYRPRAERVRTRLVHALYQEIAAIPFEVSDRGVARVKLDWWHIEASALADGKPRHALTRAYHDAYGLDGEIAHGLHALVAGLDRELGGRELVTHRDQLSWYEDTFAPIYRLLCVPGNGHVAGDEQLLGEFGCHIEMGYALLGLRALSLKQLHRLSKATVVNAGVNWDDFSTDSNATAVTALVEAESLRVSRELTEIRARLPRSLRHRARTLATLGEIVDRTLAEMRADGNRVWLHRVQLTPLRKLWCAYRTRWR